MKKKFILSLGIVSFILSLVQNSAFADAITSEAFGLNINRELSIPLLNGQNHIPVKAGSRRLWDAGVTWAQIETSPGFYDFTLLDKLLDRAALDGMTNIEYTFYRVPTWDAVPSAYTDATKTKFQPEYLMCGAEMLGNSQCCNSSDGGCALPDMTAYQNFVNALLDHCAERMASGKNYITEFELWNEPEFHPYWAGTVAQLAQYTSWTENAIHAWGNNHSTKVTVLSPTVIIGPDGTYSFMDQYFNAYVGQNGKSSSSFDAIATHSYGPPEWITGHLANVSALLAKYSITVPVWSTEGSWTGNISPLQQAANLSRMIFMSFNAKSPRFYVYSADNSAFGNLIDLATGKLTPAGTAFNTLQSWLVGATFNGCTSSGTVWSCNINQKNYEGIITWDTAGTCNESSCPITENHAMPPRYTYAQHLDGTGHLDYGFYGVSALPIILMNTNPVVVHGGPVRVLSLDAQ